MVASSLVVGFEPPPLFSDIYWMIVALETIVFEVRALALFLTLFTTPLTNPPAL